MSIDAKTLDMIANKLAVAHAFSGVINRVPEITAWIGATIVIKQGVEWLEDFWLKIESVKRTLSAIFNISKPENLLPWILALFLPIALPILGWSSLTAQLKKRVQLNQITPEQYAAYIKAVDSWQTELVEWLLSATLAYVILFELPDLIEKVGGLISLATKLLAGTAGGA